MKRTTIALLAALMAAALPSTAFAYGAIAVGTTSSVAKDGFALGASTDFDSAKAAAADAMKQCKTGDSSAATKARCKVVESFNDQCFAVAFDRRANKSGLGWAVAPTRWGARSKAMGMCRETGGRGSFCSVGGSSCDRR